MEYILACLGLIPGLLFLVKGSDFFLNGSLSIAKNLRILPVLMGLVVLALGVSLPECGMCTIASLNKGNSYSVGFVINSNFFNIMVMGVCAAILPLKVSKKFAINIFPFSIIAVVILLGFIIVGSDMNIGGADDYGLASFSGLTMLVLFVLSLVVLINYGLKNKVDIGKAPYPLGLSILYTFVGYVVLMAGSFFTATFFRKTLHFVEADTFITNVISVILFTSLPELAVGVRAAIKGHGDLLIGCLTGSNIFNILFVLGLSSVISPVDLYPDGISYIEDIMLLIFANIMIIALFVKNKSLKHKSGFIMIVIYLTYTAFLIGRNYNLLPYISCF